MRKPHLFFILLALILAAPRIASTQSAPAPAEISADLGACSALITVTGDLAKPVYGAKMTARVQYGIMGVKKLDLEAYTGQDGKLKITGLPETLKKPLVIHFEKDGKTGQAEYKPADGCHATFDIHLK